MNAKENTSHQLHSPVYTEPDAATYLEVSQQFLRQSRHYGNRPGRAEGPPFVRLGGGRSIRYLKSDLDAWLLKYRCHPTPAPEGEEA